MYVNNLAAAFLLAFLLFSGYVTHELVTQLVTQLVTCGAGQLAGHGHLSGYRSYGYSAGFSS